MTEYTDKQNSIINAAIELIAEKGIQKLTIKNLSAKIGVVEGALYRHFKSKIEILLGILKIFETTREKSLSQTGVLSIDPLVQMEQLFTERFNYFSKNPAIASVIFSEEIFQNEKILSERVYQIMQKSVEHIQKIIESGQQLSKFRSDISATQLSLIIAGSLRLIVTQWRLSGYAFDIVDAGNELWKSIKQIVTK